MHPGNLKWLTKLRKTYPTHFTNVDVLEIGAYNINGTARDFFTDTKSYVGVDQVAGPCVDVVCEARKTAFQPGQFDTLVYLSVIEHDPEWAAGFEHNLQWIKTGGLIIICFGAEGNKRHDPEPWALVPAGDFLAAASTMPLKILDAFFESDRGWVDCPGAYDVVALKITKIPF
jgi:hypothetical protein